MSLAISYSSDEEEILASTAKDVFALSALPVAKKIRVKEISSSTDAAPHVLSEVGHLRFCKLGSTYILSYRTL